MTLYATALGKRSPALLDLADKPVAPRPTGRPVALRCRNDNLADTTNLDLVSCYQDTACTRCLDALLDNNTGLLYHVLRRFTHAKEPEEDLLQVARLGLLKAAQRFDRDRGLSFATYTVAIIDGEVRHHLRDNLLLRQPRWARTLYHDIQSAQARFFERHQRWPSVQELAGEVNVTEEGLLEVLRVYAQLDLQFLGETSEQDGDGVGQPDASRVRALRYESFTLPIEERISLYQALAKLSEMQKRLVYLLFFKELSQREVAQEMGVSQRTISREQTKALGRLRALLSRKAF